MKTVNYTDFLTADKPEKKLTWGRKRGVGRNNQGRITVRHKGSGHKIPTGIPSRRLILHLKAKDDRGNIIYQEDRYYRKALADKPA